MNKVPECDVIGQTQQWFERVVLGLNLCPFAHVPAKEKRVRFVVVKGADERALLATLSHEISCLNATPALELETTLVIAAAGFDDFYTYNAMLGYLEHWLLAEGWEGFVQIASFHPNYQFAGTKAGDPQNLTNRSPYPLFHLIREASLTQVIDNGADTDAIPERNIARVTALSDAERKVLFPYLFPSP